MADKKSTARAAQSSEPRGPKPKAPQHHNWNTAEELDAQLAMPVHLVTGKPSTLAEAKDGNVRFHTACGLAVGLELLRSTDDRKAVTCAKCKSSRKR